MTKKSPTVRPVHEEPTSAPDFDDEKALETLRQTADSPKPSKARARAWAFLEKFEGRQR